MDVEKLIRRLRNDADAYRNGETLGRAFADQEDVLDNAATALSTLQAENEKLRAELNICREKNAGLALALLTECAPNPDCLGDDEWRAIRDKLEQVKRERDDLIEDFVDYVTGGVPNPAIFCKNRCDECTDMRGWCTGKDCRGFYPSGASGQKED